MTDRVRKIYEERQTIWGQVHAIVEPAALEMRDLTRDEERIFNAGCARLDELLVEQRALQAGQQTKQPKEPNPDGGNADRTHRLRQRRLELAKTRGEQTVAAIATHIDRMHGRDLEKHLHAMEIHDNIAQMQAQLEAQRKLGDLTQSAIDHHDRNNN